MPRVDSDEEKIRWYLTACYICDCIQPLPKSMNLKLTHVSEQYGEHATWRELVEADQLIDAPFVRDVHSTVSQHVDSFESLVFLMRGLGCPFPEARLKDVFGFEQKT